MTTNTEQAVELKPCPFCGGDAEMDTRQGYTNYFNGRPETGIAIYCRACGVQQMICRGDVPDVEPEHVIELWNRRALLSQEAKKDRDDGWQDIATAPKDGTEILLRRGERVGAAAWVEWEKRASEYHANGTYLGEYVQDGGASWTIGLDGNSWDGERKPTHWRPLPAPPAPSEGEAS
jgi:hypothetical protein